MRLTCQRLVSPALLALAVLGCGSQSSYDIERLGPKTMVLTCPSFKHGGTIPENHTRVSPRLDWVNAPPGTRSFALNVRDLDARQWRYIHWMVYNIPAEVNCLAEGAGDRDPLWRGTVQPAYYTGMAPGPGQTHRYMFTLFALDTVLNPPAVLLEFDQLEAAVTGHVLARAELLGVYTQPYGIGPKLF